MEKELTKYLKAKSKELKKDWSEVPTWVIKASSEFFREKKQKVSPLRRLQKVISNDEENKVKNKSILMTLLLNLHMVCNVEMERGKLLKL